MRIIIGTYSSNDELATARERELAEKIMQDPNFEELVGWHMECHNRFRAIALPDLEPKNEDVNGMRTRDIMVKKIRGMRSQSQRTGKVVLRILNSSRTKGSGWRNSSIKCMRA